MSRGVCAIAGVGPGNGASFVRRFAEDGYEVAMLARSTSVVAKLEETYSSAHAYPVDVTREGAVVETFARIREDLGPIDVLVHNAGWFTRKPFDDTSAEELETAWRVNTLSLLLTARQVAGDMVRRSSGNIVVIGATASLRGGAMFAALASSKSAQYVLAQSMARYLGPKGVHVSYVVVDGVIDTPRAREMIDAADAFFLDPDRIADTVANLVAQDRSAWTFQIDLRPFGESW